MGRPLTLADKVLLGHLDDPENQEIEPGKSYLLLHPDGVILQDVFGQTAMFQFMQTLREKVAAPTTPLRPSYPGASRASLTCTSRYRKIRKLMLPPFRALSTAPASGGRAPGSFTRWCWNITLSLARLIIGTDSHTPNAGGLGLAVGVGGADAVDVLPGCPGRCSTPRISRCT